MARLQKTFPFRVAARYGESQSVHYASVIAFNAFLVMFPLVLEVVALLSFVLRNHGLELRFEQSIVPLFPAVGTRSNIVDSISQVQKSGLILSLFSLAVLIWTSANFFSALEFAFDQILEVEQRSLVRQEVLGALMLIAFTTVLLLLVGISTLLDFLPFLSFVGLIATTILMIVVVALIYWVVPNRRQQWRQVWPGAVLAGVLITLLTLVWPLYARFVHDPNAYDQTLAVLFIFATWLYLLSQLVLLGAVVNKSLLELDPGSVLAKVPGLSPRRTS